MNNSFSGANLNNIKEMNISAVLKTIFEHEGISRTDIASSTEMSCAFVTKVLTNLTSKRIVLEAKNSAVDRGRPKVSLCFNYDRFVMVGLRINAKYISSALCSSRGELLCHYSSSIEDRKNGEEIYIKCCELIDLALSHKKDKIVLGIGVAAPGPLPPEHDRVTVINESNFADFKDIALIERLEKEYGVSVVLMHDAHCGALNEYIFRETKERYRNIVFIATDNGVGAGIIIDGKPYNGSGFAGEISNMIIGRDDELVPLSAVLSQKKLISDCGCESITEVIERVRIDDTVCCEHFDRFIRYLTVAVSNFITTVSPEAIVISDSIALLKERVEKLCKETLSTLLPEDYKSSVEIIVRPYSKHSVLRGACGAILHKALEEPCKYFEL